MKRGGRDGETKVGQGHYEDQQHETNGDSDGCLESRFYLLAATSINHSVLLVENSFIVIDVIVVGDICARFGLLTRLSLSGRSECWYCSATP